MTTSCGTSPTVSIRQHTVQQSAQWRNDRHRRRTDVLMVHPADADSGVRFLRHGTVSEADSISAHWDAVVDTRGGIVLGNTHGMTLRGAIPLLAALRVAGVDNAIVEVHGSRIPAEVSDFDFYLDMLADVGAQAQAAARRLLCVTDTVEVRDRFGFVTLSPDTEFRACVNMTTIQPGGNTDTACVTLVSDFTEPHAGFSVTLDGSREEQLVEAGDAHASRPLREIHTLPGPLRATLVEMIGYLALAGAPVAANVYGHSSEPRLYQALLHALMERRAVTLTTVDAHRARHRTTAHAVADAATKSGCGTDQC
jgi:UDP-3-O-[3-hydroxymyristoyl] N-acetylglucosamine deacetylase